MPYKTTILAVFLIVIQGCSLYAPERRHLLPERFPSKYSLYSENGPEQETEWWRAFNSPELNTLVEKAMGDNFSIREAWARLKQAEASAKRTRADQMPELTGKAGYSGTDGKESGFSDTFSLGLAASYELDLWGRLKSGRKAAASTMEASRADLDAAATTVAASVAETWVDIIATRREIALRQAQITSNKSLLKLQELRFEKSMASALDVLQQRQILEQSESRLPPLTAREKLLVNTLSILMGEPPGVLSGMAQDRLPAIGELPETGLPADLLAMRPDIRAAGLRLKAADWEISAARAARLPTLSLTGSYTFEGDGMDTLFNNWILNLASNLTGPIFDAGRRKADVMRARAVADERLAFYKKTVVNAVGEVEEQLINESMQKESLRLLAKEIRTAEYVLKEAEKRYTRGLDNYLPILTGLLKVQDLEQNMIQQRAALVKYRIGLYRAMGGEWTKNKG